MNSGVPLPAFFSVQMKAARRMRSLEEGQADPDRVER